MTGNPRILVLVPGPAEESDLRAEVSNLGLLTNLAPVFRAVPAAPPAAASPADRVLSDVAILEAGLTAEHDGFAAVVIDSFEDCGLAALRSRLSIPVVAPGKASLLYCLTLAGRFGLLLPPDAVARGRAFVRECGLDRHCVSVRSVEAPDIGREGLVAAVAAQVREGAEAVCLGDPALRALAGAARDGTTVPLVEPFRFALKWTESLLALNLTHSRQAYPAPMVLKDNLVRGLLHGA